MAEIKVVLQSDVIRIVLFDTEPTHVPSTTHNAKQTVSIESRHMQEPALTVTNQEPTEERAQIIRVEPPPSTNAEPLESNSQPLPETRSGREKLFFRRSM
jgi:hypothetical protein